MFSTWIQYPEQEGEPGSAAQHLECWVHDVHVLTCSWQVGREAPRDVQYHLYLENVNTEQRWQCPQYTANDQGTHVQCRFGNISGFASTQYRLLVNGTSKDSRIRCSELVTPLSYIENLSAPNMTASCNKSDSIMEWKMSSHLNTNFKYELEIQKGTDAPYIQKVWKTSFVLSSPRVYTARIRALVSDLPPGQWSAPQRFVCDHEEDARLHFWVIPSVTAVATLLTVGLAVLLWKRCSLQRKLFPPIPRTKNPLSDDTQDEKMMNWEGSRAGQEECPVADVQVLGET
ncbi:interleukin-3 receptor subunit alpha [Pteropus medius]|uniref:interleukin-3 receptor subunit alpha n=1 Tax=Pteropus vampyrus TaxID=132908 RepID=UPI00196B111C|nr:interleukin-3 receptor subunit alpha [Pteropus giganteus]